MQNVPVMDCADGNSRADNAYKRATVAKTASYTILKGQSGTVFTNRGSAADITFTLPAPVDGMYFTFWKAVIDKDIVLNTDVAGTKIHGGVGATQGVTVTNNTDTEYGSVSIYCDGTAWFVVGQSGTWAIS